MSVQELEESIQIENVVASSDLETELDLAAIATDLNGSDYDPEQFPGLVYRIDEPKSASLIFRSGKVVCTGAKSPEDVSEAIHMVFEEIRDLDLDVPDKPEITVENIVTSADLKEELNLNAIAIGLGLEKVEYEPEQFPGLVYRLDEPDVVALMFGSGKAVITGGKEPSDADEAVAVLVDELTELGLIGDENPLY